MREIRQKSKNPTTIQINLNTYLQHEEKVAIKSKETIIILKFAVILYRNFKND